MILSDGRECALPSVEFLTDPGYPLSQKPDALTRKRNQEGYYSAVRVTRSLVPSVAVLSSCNVYPFYDTGPYIVEGIPMSRWDAEDHWFYGNADAFSFRRWPGGAGGDENRPSTAEPPGTV